jgi:hypothetical protein
MNRATEGQERDHNRDTNNENEDKEREKLREMDRGEDANLSREAREGSFIPPQVGGQATTSALSEFIARNALE